MVVCVQPGAAWAIHLLAGKARFADGSPLPDLGAGDTVILETDASRSRYVLDGAGEALLIRVVAFA